MIKKVVFSSLVLLSLAGCQTTPPQTWHSVVGEDGKMVIIGDVVYSI